MIPKFESCDQAIYKSKWEIFLSTIYGLSSYSKKHLIGGEYNKNSKLYGLNINKFEKITKSK